MNALRRLIRRVDFSCKPSILAIAALILLGGDCLLAQDWPQWRGANRDGKATGFSAPAAWPASLTKKWQVAAGKGDATPVLVGEKLYAFGRQGTDEVVTCLEAATGKTLWEAKYPASRDIDPKAPDGGHPGPRGTPVVAGGKIFTFGLGNVLSCFDAAKGTLVWRKQSSEDYQGASTKSAPSMSPIVVDGLCIVHVGDGFVGSVIAFDAASGQPKWKWDGEGPTNSSPMLLTVGGKKQLVILTSKSKEEGSLVGLSLASGAILWQTPASQGDNTSPIIEGSTVICCGQGKGLFAVKIESRTRPSPNNSDITPEGDLRPHYDEVFTATALWTNKPLGAQIATPVLKDGLLFGYNGSFFCADAKTGATLWTDTAKRGQSVSIVDAGPVLFALTIKGELIAYEPGKTQYKQLASYKVAGTETWGHPVVAGTRIFVKDVETLSLWTFGP